MDPHELAIAALNEVAHPSSHRRDKSAGKFASPRSSPNATGIDMTNNAIVDNIAGAQEPSQQLPGTNRTMSQVERGQGYQHAATPGVQSTSSNNSQSMTDGNEGVSTPPTSTSDGFSSQSTNQEVQMSQLSQLSQLAAAQQPLTSNVPATRPNLAVATTAGQKRTADGQVKGGVLKSPTSPQVRGHSRNTSTVSNVSATSSRIGEVGNSKVSKEPGTDAAQLSSELRTRLSYAMVKVNNGWQSNSIDEVESLASQAGSPTSSTSTLQGRRNLLTSPRTAIANIQGQSSSMSNSVTQAPTGDFDLYSRTEQPSRTYESFWRDHSTSVPSHRQAYRTSPPQHSKSLAPPADIRPTPTSRRSHTPKFSKPPAIPGQNSTLGGSFTSTPRTPTMNHRPALQDSTMGIQTPTQKTIQEQDAIETLLFMSSPGNSGNMGHGFQNRGQQGSPQQSPLRAEFNVQGQVQETPRGAQGRRVGFEKVTLSGSTGSSEAGGAGKRKSRSEAIDKFLDEFNDSSSDEGELVINYSSPRRVAAGRV
jgi:hypothetical protein